MKQIKVTIKITDGETWTEDCPLEFDIEQAKALYEELEKLFRQDFPQWTLQGGPLK